MERFKYRWRRTPKSIRVPLVFIVGWLIVVTGVFLIPLPGPGWAIVFIGFAILATEFATAGKVRDHMVRILRAIIAWFQDLWNRIRGKH